jgi:O-antigen/teichoic acid export membrane protein
MSAALRTLLTPDRWPMFARGMLAYGSAEAVTRVVRLGAILIVARQTSPEMLGTAALALSLFELIRVLTQVGIGQRIITASAEELASICKGALQLFWIACATVTAIQLAIASLAWLAFDLREVGAMLAALSLVYLFMPAGLVQIFLAMRAQRMGATARVAASQNIADCLLTIALVLVWPSAWAIVLPKLLTAPLWLVLARRTFSWKPDPSVHPAPAKAFTSFGLAILGSEMLAAARLHGDKLLVGALLGTEALGLYYFAFNAGLGITQSLVAACNLVLFPHLVKAGKHRLSSEFKRAFVMGMAVVIPLVAAQALLAPFYVPILFGETWVPATPYLSILACAAIPLFVGALLGARYRAENRPIAETGLMAMATLAASIGLTLGAQESLSAACFGFGLGLAIILLPAAATAFLTPRTTRSPNPQGGLQ